MSPVYFFTLADRVCSIILIVTSFIVAFKKASTCVIIILQFYCSRMSDKALLTIPMRRLNLRILLYLSNVFGVIIVESRIRYPKLWVLIHILKYTNFHFCRERHGSCVNPI